MARVVSLGNIETNSETRNLVNDSEFHMIIPGITAEILCAIQLQKSLYKLFCAYFCWDRQ